ATVQEALARAHARHPLSLTVVSNHAGLFRELSGAWRFPAAYLEWNAATFEDALRLHDVAIIPVQRNPFTLCKTNNRVMTALAAGLPVVADAIPSYEEFAACAYLDRWDEGLAAYAVDPALRMRHVQAGQAILQARYTLPTIADQWERLLMGELALQQSGNRESGAVAGGA
ncbi:MAG TPA: glycosyltransferase, partial [bacterium]